MMHYRTRVFGTYLFLAVATGLMYAPASSHSQCSPLMTFTGEGEYNYFGSSAAAAGDVNNDGYPDLIIGASSNDAGGNGAGRAYVYSGETGLLLYTFTGEGPSEYFGSSVSGAGDVDGDGYSDLIIGAYASDSGGNAAGRAYVYSGQFGTLIYTITGGADIDYLGWSVSGAGDADGDGFDDFIVGVPGFGANNGGAFVYSGKTGARMYTIFGSKPYAGLGKSLSGAGDVNQDGYADFIVGASNSPTAGGGLGRAFVYSGRTGTPLYTFEGEGAGGDFGNSVSGAGDVDGDGYPDLIVGAKNDAEGGISSGSAYVYSGKTGLLLHKFVGPSISAQFGSTVSAAGDVDNDGFDDLIVSAHYILIGTETVGKAYVYSGRNWELLYELAGELGGDHFAFMVAGAGDINKDGFDDLLIGAETADVGGNSAVGRAFVFSAYCGCCVTPGDADNDGSFNIADVTFGIARIFGGGPAAACQDEADANGYNSFNIADVTYGIARIFGGGAAPVCGSDGF